MGFRFASPTAKAMGHPTIDGPPNDWQVGQPMRIVFLGSGAFAVPTLRWLTESEHDVALVVTQPARPSGRRRRTTPTPVGALADELELERLEAEDVNEPQIARKLLALELRIGLVVAFGQKLGRIQIGLVYRYWGNGGSFAADDFYQNRVGIELGFRL